MRYIKKTCLIPFLLAFAMLTRAQSIDILNNSLYLDENYSYEVINSVVSTDAYSIWAIVLIKTSADESLELWEIDSNSEVAQKRKIYFESTNFKVSGLEAQAFEMKFLDDNTLLFGQIIESKTVLVKKYSFQTSTLDEYIRYTSLPGEEITFFEFGEGGEVFIAGNYITPFLKIVRAESEVALETQFDKLSNFYLNKCFFDLPNDRFLLCGTDQNVADDGSSRVILISMDGEILETHQVSGQLLQVSAASENSYVFVSSEKFGIVRPDSIEILKLPFQFESILDKLRIPLARDPFSVLVEEVSEFFAYSSSNREFPIEKNEIIFSYYVRGNLMASNMYTNGNVIYRSYKDFITTHQLLNGIMVIGNIEVMDDSRILRQGIEVFLLAVPGVN